MPAGASLDRTDAVSRDLYGKIKDIEGIVAVNFIKGRSLINGTGSNYGFGIIKLADWADREDASLLYKLLQVSYLELPQVYKKQILFSSHHQVFVVLVTQLVSR